MVSFSKFLNAISLPRLAGRRQPRATEAAPAESTPSVSAARKDELYAVTVLEGANFESVKLSAPDSAWERHWPRHAASTLLPTQPSLDSSTSTAPTVSSIAQGHAWDAAVRAAVSAVALAASAALLSDSIPLEARKCLQRGVQLLQDAMDADLASAALPGLDPIPELTAPPSTSASTGSTIERYPHGVGVHHHLASPGRLVFDLAAPERCVLYRARGARAYSQACFSKFEQQSAVEPPVKKLVILSRQLAYAVNVRAAAGSPFVTVADVLRRMKDVARDTLRETEFQWILRTPDGRGRLSRAYQQRTARLPHAGRAIEPLRFVDTLGEETILAGLRVDVDHEALRELIPRPWSQETEETLHLVAEFTSLEHVRAVLGRAEP